MAYSIKRADFIHAGFIFDIMNQIGDGMDNPGYFVKSDMDFIQNHIERQGVTFLAQDKNQPIGFLIIDIPGGQDHNLGLDIGLPPARLNSAAHMDTVAVLPEYRGMRLQKALLEQGEDYMKQLGYTDFLATVHPDNSASLNNFLRCGYRVKETKLKYGGFLRHILHKNKENL